MSTESLDTTASQIRERINRLQSPIPDVPELLSLLAAPLDSVGLLPPQYRAYNTSPLPPASVNVPRHFPLLQRALLEYVIPTWGAVLAEQKLTPLVERYFIPDSFTYATPAAGDVALCAYSTLLSIPLTDAAIRLLAALSRAYPIDRLYATVFAAREGPQRGVAWEDAVRNVLAVPAKVANALAGAQDAPPELEQGVYFDSLCKRCEVLVAELAPARTRENVSSLVYLLGKLVNVGAFPSAPPTAPSQPSFFASTLDAIRGRLVVADASSAAYSAFWSELLLAVPSIFTLQNILTSLFAHLSVPKAELGVSPRVRGEVKREARVLCRIVGTLTEDKKDLWDAVAAAVLGRDWTQAHARVFSCWAAGAQKGAVNEEALGVLLTNTIDLWSSPDYVKHSLLSKHRYVTLLLLTTISYLPASSSVLTELVLSPTFVRSISQYIGHLDPSVRRCGMLVAEELAQRTGKKLNFDDWEGEDGGKPWARAARALITETDADAEVPLDEQEATGEPMDVEDLLTDDIIEPPKPSLTLADPDAYDSDDSLTGYASPSSSRSPSPTPSELRDIEKDPTLRVGKTKIARPVYLAQLGEMIRSTSGLKSEYENQEADKHEVALAVAEELIRRKRGYGTELEENAVNLVYGLIGLQDNYEIEDFDRKRQAALNALVACCPQKAAPAIAEEFFKNQYSSEQRFVMLNALALGARELADLPLPESVSIRPLISDRTSFPSRRLPPALHDRYMTEASTQQVQGLLLGITRQTIDSTRESNASTVPALARERRLRLQQPAKITELQRPSADEVAARLRSTSLHPAQAPLVPFTEVAVECFIYPLLNRFWLFLRDEQTREVRTAQRDKLHRYRGAGTGLILSAPVLAHFMATLGVLVHAARHAPAWLSVVAPDALEMAVTLGTRPMSMGPDDEDEEADGEGEEAQGKEARVLSTALELALVVLDGCLELDGGRALSLEHTALLLAAGEWAGEVFSRLEKGLLVKGGGGAAEARLSKAAAGVVLKANEASERWKRSMIDLSR